MNAQVTRVDKGNGEENDMKKRIVWGSEGKEFVWEIECGLFYLDQDKNNVLIVRPQTDDEGSGFVVSEALDLEITESESETYTIAHTISIELMKRVAKELLKVKA